MAEASSSNSKSAARTLLSVPSVADIRNLEDPALSRQRRLSEYADIVIGHTVGGSTVIIEGDQQSPLNQFEEKVQLERSSNGLVISPSTAAMMQLAVANGTIGEKRRSRRKSWKNRFRPTQQMMPRRTHQSRNKEGWRKYGGIIFAFLSSFFFSLTVMMAKMLSEWGYHPFSTAVWRYCGIFLPSIPIIFYYWRCKKKEEEDGGIGIGMKEETPGIFSTISPLRDREKMINFLGLMLRGLLGCTSVLFRFYSLNYLTLADSSVISYSGPIFVVIVAHFVLGEKCGIVSIFVAVLTAFGVFVICRPPLFTGSEFSTNTLIGALLATLSMVCNSTVAILMRKIRQVHFALMLFTFGLWGVAESVIVASSFQVIKFPEGVRDSLVSLVCLPVLVFLGQISIILALKFENAGPVSLIRSCDVIFSFVWQLIFLGTHPDLFSLIGATIVVFGVSITAIQKWVSTLPPENKMRRRLRFILK